MKNKIFPITYAILIFSSISGYSQWYTDPTMNTVVCDTAEDQNFVKIVSDEKGGAYLVWTDHRNESGLLAGDIYGQHLNGSGYSQWAQNGIPINAGMNAQVVPELMADGTGGFIIAWQLKFGLFYDRDLYAQRVDSLGNFLWNSSGAVITTMGGTNSYHNMVTNDNGGAIIVWQNLPGAGGDVNIYGQHLDQNGQALWVADGMIICDEPELQSYPVQAADGNGGSMITWSDSRNGFPNVDIYLQHVAGNGNISFAANGIPVCSDSVFQDNPKILNIGSGNYIIVWEDNRNANWDLYMQKMDTTGTMYFPSNGVPVCLNVSDQNNPAIMQDGAGGFIIAWTDLRADAGNIYAQRYDSNGNAQWLANGVAICTAADVQDLCQIVPDNQGGAIISWMDYRHEWLGDVYAQRIDQNGNLLWNADGIAICTATGEQWGQQIISNDQGGAIIAWDDTRNGTDDNICAQNINHQGILGVSSQTYNRTNLNKAITDFQITTDTIDFTIQTEMLQSDLINDVTVFIDTVFHEADGDLTFTLRHNGITDTLIHRTGGNGNNFISTVLNDSSNQSIISGTAPFNGIYQPYQPLSVFKGMQAPGLWILEVYDGTAANIGTLQAWGLSITYQENPANIKNPESDLAKLFQLKQNYPNPFNPTTKIEYELPYHSEVKIEVFNSLGKKVATLVNSFQQSGNYIINFDGSNFSSGVYFCRLLTENYSKINKMLLVK